ncbi:translocation protein [Aaosphaeria arxii CBS 175.79]|uniref:Translocation protein SEC62 n=1 Tax=Aaosphaeria arxii CBS 175.79 TaxID=1450172 RepID=A0A6A5XBT4_9PLEO|nr:translocation protein [Aaosphaeria arxii CBS 175.79]KAF2010359.1 translocation protein [Aaosphaeria arxii CBS 175.79]
MAGINFQGPQGQQPSPEQIAMMQRQIASEAEKAGLTIPQYIERLKAQAMQQHQAQMEAQRQAQIQQQQQAQQGQAQPIQPGPPKPEAIAVANFLKSQDLKLRTVILDEKRKDMFRVKRALRALQSPAYAKARSKNPLLPEVNDRVTAENTFKLLPLSLLALRVNKVDESQGHEGHNHAAKKRVKGLWTVRIEQHQEAGDDHYYVWLFEGAQWKQKLYAGGALLLILAVVLFPLWPLFMRQGVWYLSMGMLGLIGLFFAMAIFRLILFIITMFAAPPGLWLYPNLFEDVGFFDSFKPLWAWQETPEDIKNAKRAKKERKAARAAAKADVAANGRPAKASKKAAAASPEPTPAQPAAAPVDAAPQPTGSQAADPSSVSQRPRHATVEEDDEE